VSGPSYIKNLWIDGPDVLKKSYKNKAKRKAITLSKNEKIKN
jgi:hypothetical protein